MTTTTRAIKALSINSDVTVSGTLCGSPLPVSAAAVNKLPYYYYDLFASGNAYKINKRISIVCRQ